MVLKKSDVHDQVTRRNKIAIEEAIKVIDETLARTYNGLIAEVDASKLSSLSKIPLDEVLKLYRAAGWTIERKVGGDMRESFDYYVFS